MWLVNIKGLLIKNTSLYNEVNKNIGLYSSLYMNLNSYCSKLKFVCPISKDLYCMWFDTLIIFFYCFNRLNFSSLTSMLLFLGIQNIYVVFDTDEVNEIINSIHLEQKKCTFVYHNLHCFYVCCYEILIKLLFCVKRIFKRK